MKFLKWLRKYFRVSYNDDGVPTFGFEMETDKIENELERRYRDNAGGSLSGKISPKGEDADSTSARANASEIKKPGY